ncbi:hypothetical protein B0G82_0983 [Paraburkholderia sp. BL17N1]|nr:hypothetical protein B0G82_0983 [Paraburkholderia sp. BL17N1]
MGRDASFAVRDEACVRRAQLATQREHSDNIEAAGRQKEMYVRAQPSLSDF